MRSDFIKDGGIDIQAVFDAFANKAAYIHEGREVSYAGLSEELSGVVAILQDIGVSPGRMVALRQANSPLHLLFMLAAWVTGFTLVSLDPKAPPGRVPAGIRPDLVICCDTGADWGGAGVVSPEIFSRKPALPKTGPFAPVPLDREASVVFTSGSTGPPKGVVHTVGNLVYSALGTIEHLDMSPKDRWLVSLPLFHAGGILIPVRALLSGGAAIFHGDPGRLSEAILKQGPTIISLVPTQLLRLMESPEALRALSSMKAVLLGGGPCPAGIIDKALGAGIPIISTYGSTEACAMVTAASPGASRSELKTAGRAIRHRTLEIHQNGVIVLGGKTLFKHYISDGKVLPAVFHGKFTTSDLGRTDPDGNLTVLGRRDQVFISGGENINPFEIESAITGTGLAEEAVVVPVSHRLFGTVAWAFVKPVGAHDEEGLKCALLRVLPPYKIPKRILPFPEESGPGGLKRSRKGLEEAARRLSEEK